MLCDAPIGRSLEGTGAFWTPGKHKVQGFPLHAGQSPAQRWLRSTPGCVWAGQAEGTGLATNLHPRGHTCPISARQGCSGTSTGLGGLCISIPPPSYCQPAMLLGHGCARGLLSPLLLNYFGFLPGFTALQDASITRKNA